MESIFLPPELIPKIIVHLSPKEIYELLYILIIHYKRGMNYLNIKYILQIYINNYVKYKPILKLYKNIENISSAIYISYYTNFYNKFGFAVYGNFQEVLELEIIKNKYYNLIKNPNDKVKFNNICKFLNRSITNINNNIGDSLKETYPKSIFNDKYFLKMLEYS